MGRPLILVTMGTNEYPFIRLYNYLLNEPLYKDRRCEWFIQYGVVDIVDPPAVGKMASLVSRIKMEDLVRRSSLVISHCGIGSLNLMLKYRKRTVFVPRVAAHGEFSDDHQLQIAAEIKNRRIKVVFPDDVFPLIDFELLQSEPETSTPVDITNYNLARVIENKLTG